MAVYVDINKVVKFCRPVKSVSLSLSLSLHYLSFFLSVLCVYIFSFLSRLTTDYQHVWE